MDFYITDVFGQEKYSGNQLATFLHCGDLSDREMQQIAWEINFSETPFVLSDLPRDGGYEVRIFTPATEIDFAGHPTLIRWFANVARMTPGGRSVGMTPSN
jgi:trans-2,3-dihydro-3-hydroxyanthranilate isomerase